jgi:hypothetical protein
VSLLPEDQRAHQRKLYEEGDSRALLAQAPQLSLRLERFMGLYRKLRTERPMVAGGFGATIGQIPETKIEELLDREKIFDDSTREELAYYFRTMEGAELEAYAKDAKARSTNAGR